MPAEVLLEPVGAGHQKNLELTSFFWATEEQCFCLPARWAPHTRNPR